MRRFLSRGLLALGAFLLLFCLAFTVVQLCAGDYIFFEEQFIKLDLEKTMGISISDLSQAVRAMVQYMNGQRSTIDVDIMLNGVKTPMFVLEVEHVHMVEVRTLWQSFISYRSVALFIAVGTLLPGFLPDSKHIWNNIAVGYLWALGLFLVICFFAGIWAGTNFDSFWTLFHKIVFPGSENWLLPYESRMIQMLPGELFSALVGRIGLYALGIALGIGVLCLLSILYRSGKIHLPDIKKQKEAPQKEEPIKVLSEDGPDLLTLHKLHNTPVSRRQELNRQLEERKNALQREKSYAEREQAELREENPDRVSITFASYESSVSESEETEETEETEEPREA